MRSAGLIPAGAGQIQDRMKGSHHSGAHPRRCEADKIPNWQGRVCTGSSPQVRGRSLADRPIPIIWGLIPAGAGQMR
ncbi:hypothetical protein HMPREF0294_0592 [Corynebacterium glucuronolyticum ATCC 51867]|nr:hypothetical protein HMPREF0294_0592 [Corynebacterium glucuronolyticum ATCC 51867]